MSDTELEDQLTAMFERRAGDIRTEPKIDFPLVEPGKRRVEPDPVRDRCLDRSGGPGSGGSVVGIRSIHHSPSAHPVATPTTGQPSVPAFIDPVHPTDSAGNCLFLPATPTDAWQTAISNGTKLNLDHPDNTVISVNGSSAEYLMVQSSPNTQQTQARYGQWTLALFHGATGQDIVDSPAGTPESPIADAAGAISPNWIAYGLVHPQQNDGYYKVQLYDRGSTQLTTVDEVSDAQYSAGSEFIGTPVIYDGRLYWLQSTIHQPALTVLKSYDLQSGARTSEPAPTTTGLFYYGDGLALVTTTGTHNEVHNQLGKSLPAWVLKQMAGASVLSYAGPVSATGGQANISWLAPMSDWTRGPGYYTWSEGADHSISDGLTGNSDRLELPGGAFIANVDATGNAQILDDRTGIRNSSSDLISLPTGLTFQALVGPDLLFAVGATKDGASSFVMVKVSSLPKPTDYPGC